MESAEFHGAAAILAWQIELGADEAICDAPVDRYALPAAMDKPAAPKPADGEAVQARPGVPVAQPAVDGVALARAAAAGAGDLEALRAAVANFDLCDLKRGARNLVFGEGATKPRVMVIGDAPDRYEDREGRPFVGQAGALLDKMFDAIELARGGEAATLYVCNALPWRPPQGRDPKPEELALMLPFLERKIALLNPDVLVLMGNISCQALLGKRGITRLRGAWVEVHGRPALPMLNPAQLLKNPLAKRDAWADLLSLKARLG